MEQVGSDDAGRRAASSYREGVSPLDGWPAEFAETFTGPDGHVVVPTTFRRGEEVLAYRADAWSDAQVDLMDPETAGVIAAAHAERWLLKGRRQLGSDTA
jgi:hypothetical protein